MECYGYRIEEQDKPGALNASALLADGIKPGPLFQRLKQGETVTLEDGRVINGQDYLAAPQPGKKLAIFGDTAPCPAALLLAQGVDLMVHEATLEAAMEEKANSRAIALRTRRRSLRMRGRRETDRHPCSSRYDARGCERLLAECRERFQECELAEDFAKVSV